MIQIEIRKEGALFRKVRILGHAMYDDYGKDIVCSAVSSIVTTSVNGILSLKKESISYLVSKQGMDITIKSDDRTTQILIRNMINLLKELAKNYPDNVKIK